MMTKDAWVMVVGASRGLGLALAEEWCARGRRVVATERRPSPGLAALAARYPQSLTVETVDTADAAAVRALRQRLAGRPLDTLFVNAGISRAETKTPATADESDFLEMMRVNALAPVRLIELFADLVAGDGIIAAMSSGLGSIAGHAAGWDLYSASKAALNMLMHCFADRHPDRALLLVAPGWVRTDMGGPAATLTIGESIPLVVDTVEKNRGKAGLRFVDRFDQTLPW